MQFEGIRYTQDKDMAAELGIKYIESQAGPGLSTDPNVIYQGSNSGYQAINLAYHLGARLIIMLGYDMQITDGRAHWFGEHPDKVRSGYPGFIKQYQGIARQRLDLRIINCTRTTALHCFEEMSLASALSLVQDPA